MSTISMLRNLTLSTAPLLLIACGAGTTTSNNLPYGTYTGVFTPGLYNGSASESFVMSYNTESSVTMTDPSGSIGTIVNAGSFTSPITNSPCFTGTLVYGFTPPSGGSSCPSGSQIQFTSCSMDNNTANNNVSFTAQFTVYNVISGYYCYSGGTVTMNNYGG